MKIEEINKQVMESVNSSKDKILDAITNKFVQDELNRRTDLLTRLVTTTTTFRKEGAKIKPDLTTYNIDGSVASESWSKAQLDKKKKFEEKLAKADKAFERALNENDYNPIENLIKELKGEQKSEEIPQSC